MATKINLNNVGWRAVLDRVDGLFPDPDGAKTMKATLDKMAVNQNEHEDRLAAVEGRLDSLPFPF